MNEWELQHKLSKKYRKEKFILEQNKYDLVLWELMFPSWKINDNRGKWNEPSIDFIFYSEKKSEFLCIELKNRILGHKNLLTAFYQATHRTILFIEQYSVFKIEKARDFCFSNAILARGGINEKLKKISFDKNPTFRRMLMASSFPKNYEEKINYWNNLSLLNLKNENVKYSKNREIKRFNALSENQFSLLSDPLSTVLIPKL